MNCEPCAVHGVIVLPMSTVSPTCVACAVTHTHMATQAYIWSACHTSKGHLCCVGWERWERCSARTDRASSPRILGLVTLLNGTSTTNSSSSLFFLGLFLPDFGRALVGLVVGLVLFFFAIRCGVYLHVTQPKSVAWFQMAAEHSSRDCGGYWIQRCAHVHT